MHEKSCHVVLVHGTFATSAVWDKGSAIIEAALKEHGQVLTVANFEWSGENSHAARNAAAAALFELVLQLHQSCREARICIIAHSHGGNVALYAARRMTQELADQIVLVTWGTPFLTCRVRELDEARPLLSGSLSLWALIGTAAIGYWIFKAYGSGALTGYLLFSLIVWGKLLYEYADQGTDVIWNGIIEIGKSKQEELYDVIHGDARYHIPILCCISSRDEALLHLRILSWVSKVPGFVFDAFAFGYVSFWRSSDAKRPARTIDAFVLSYYILPFLLVIVPFLLVGVPLLLLLILLPALIRGHKYGFGREALYTALLLDLRATRLPRFITSVEIFRATAPSRGLNHSRFFGDEGTARRIAKWVYDDMHRPVPDVVRALDLPSYNFELAGRWLIFAIAGWPIYIGLWYFGVKPWLERYGH